MSERAVLGWHSPTAIAGDKGFDVVSDGAPARVMVTLADVIRVETAGHEVRVCEKPKCLDGYGNCPFHCAWSAVPTDNQRESWGRSCVDQPGDRQTVAAGIGDVNSDKPGSGARYNTGKMPIELVPISVIWDYERAQFEGEPSEACHEALGVLHSLGMWQSGGCNATDVLSLMDDPWMAASAVLDYGRKKYAEWNWAKGMPWMVAAACAVRHCLAILRDEENDPESGLPHRGHVACNLIFLAQYELTYPAGDDRPKILMDANGSPE